MMVLYPGEVPFETWVRGIFDHPEDSRDWWGEENLIDDWAWSANASVEHMTRAFEQCDEVFAPYSDKQLANGLWYLVGPVSSEMYGLLHADVPWPKCQRCIDAMFLLFEQFFAKRCAPVLSHLDEPGQPCNVICYMWWDVFPTWGKPEEPDQAELDQALLRLMERTLALGSVACQESALHGLNHWHLHYPQQIQAIFDAFLDKADSQGHLRPELKRYALAARTGMAM